MLSKRGFFGCAICAAIGLPDGRAEAQTPAGPVRTELRRIDYPAGHTIIQMMLEAPAGFEVTPHTHPGVESSLVLEGELSLTVLGQAPLVCRAGDGFQVTAGVVHSGRVGNARSKLFIHYVVEKDKPLASPA